jgi:hypothetical protein
MIHNKDIISNSLRIIGNKDISIIESNDNESDDYLYSSLVCDGGGVFNKGIAIGMQNRMIPGLIMYDNENFYGFSEKYGLSLLSPHHEYIELNIPNSMFESETKNKLQPIQKNSDNFQNLVETEKNENKNLNIDIELKDVSNFYITIPNDYSNTKFLITFDINCIYNLDSIISNVSLVFINDSNKSIFFKIMNHNSYYENNFINEITKNSILKLNVEVINQNYFLFTQKIYKK